MAGGCVAEVEMALSDAFLARLVVRRREREDRAGPARKDAA